MNKFIFAAAASMGAVLASAPAGATVYKIELTALTTAPGNTADKPMEFFWSSVGDAKYQGGGAFAQLISYSGLGFQGGLEAFTGDRGTGWVDLNNYGNGQMLLGEGQSSKQVFQVDGSIAPWTVGAFPAPGATTYQTVSFTPGSYTLTNISGSYTGPGVFTGVNGYDNTDTLTIAAVPELSTWAMVLAGFAGLGFAARRRNEGERAAFVSIGS